MVSEIDWIDKRADVAAIFTHQVRKQIRDLLRHSDPLTLTEIARSLGQSEQNIYHHLNKMLEANIIVKRTTKINGRLVTLYTLSDYYYELFGDIEQKPDISPIYILFTIYTSMTLLTLAFPDKLLSFYSIFGIETIQMALVISIVGLFTTTAILIYYLIPVLIEQLRALRDRL